MRITKPGQHCIKRFSDVVFGGEESHYICFILDGLGYALRDNKITPQSFIWCDHNANIIYEVYPGCAVLAPDDEAILRVFISNAINTPDYTYAGMNIEEFLASVKE